MYNTDIVLPKVTTVYTVMFKGLIFRGWQLGKDFHNSIFTSILPMECTLIKENLMNENFTDSKVTTKCIQFTSLENYHV